MILVKEQREDLEATLKMESEDTHAKSRQLLSSRRRAAELLARAKSLKFRIGRDSRSIYLFNNKTS